MTDKYCDYGIISPENGEIYGGLERHQARWFAWRGYRTVSFVHNGTTGRWIDLETGATVQDGQP